MRQQIRIRQLAKKKEITQLVVCAQIKRCPLFLMYRLHEGFKYLEFDNVYFILKYILYIITTVM